MTTITEKIDSKELILLDGGVSTELQKRGIPLDANVWSGLTTKTHPEEVLKVHEDYIAAGSQVITANTYSTARHVLESINLGHEAKVLNLKSVQLAKQARDNVADNDVWIAGSISSMPPLTSDRDVWADEHAEASYQELAEVLAEAGVDLIIAEMMCDIDNASMVIKAAVSTGLPVWIGYSVLIDEDSTDVKGLRWKNARNVNAADNLASILDILGSLGGQAAGIMHTTVKDTDTALEVLGQHWTGPKFAYAETGRLVVPDWDFEQVCSPDSYSREIKNWIHKHDLQIVGGCCGTGPDHIRAIKSALL